MEWKKILVAIDCSIASRRALQEAIQIGKQLNATILVMHAVPYEAVAGGICGSEIQVEAVGSSVDIVVPEKVKEYGRILLDEAAKKCQAAGVNVVKLPLGVGPPENEIIAAAKEEQCDLIIMGTHGRKGWSRMTLGSVAEYVIHHSGIPVMCLRGADHGMLNNATPIGPLKRILFPFDNSYISKEALTKLAIPVCEAMGAELHILYQIESVGVDDTSTVMREMQTAEQFVQHAKLEALKTLDKNKVFCSVAVNSGHVADSICTAAKNYDLVIMSTHGRRGLSRMMMGSVAETVLRSCNTPILTYHSQTHA